MSVTVLLLGAAADASFITAYEKQCSPWKRKKQAAGECAFFAWNDLGDAQYHLSIHADIATADVIICMISAAFLSTLAEVEFLYEALSERKGPQCVIIPVIVESCDWKEDAIFGSMQAIYVYKKQQLAEKTYLALTGIKAVVERLLEEQKKQGAATTKNIGPVYCHGCGGVLEDDTVFCSACGRRVKASPGASFQNHYHP